MFKLHNCMIKFGINLSFLFEKLWKMCKKKLKNLIDMCIQHCEICNNVVQQHWMIKKTKTKIMIFN